ETGITRHNIDLFRLDRFSYPGRRRYEPGRGRRQAVRTAQTVGRRGRPRESEEDRRGREQNGRPHSFPRVPDIKTFW
ncbi:MAG TPA: hypothetical protein VFE21_01240, partial [Rubrobacteraceae bacterium]|nr:hypothetical protein [Rubrobacteraceae bacterium]